MLPSMFLMDNHAAPLTQKGPFRSSYFCRQAAIFFQRCKKPGATSLGGTTRLCAAVWALITDVVTVCWRGWLYSRLSNTKHCKPLLFNMTLQGHRIALDIVRGLHFLHSKGVRTVFTPERVSPQLFKPSDCRPGDAAVRALCLRQVCVPPPASSILHCTCSCSNVPAMMLCRHGRMMLHAGAARRP